jgi:excisionase family DNA binding protein
MSTVDLAQLAALPDVVEQLQNRISELEERLTLAERRPYSVAEAAKALGVCEKTVRRRIDAGELQHQRTGARVVVYLRFVHS